MYIDIITAEMNNEVTSDDTQSCGNVSSSQKDTIDYIPNWKIAIEHENENRSEKNKSANPQDMRLMSDV